MDYLSVTAYGNEPTEFVLIDNVAAAASNEWRVDGDVDWGNHEWETFYSGPRGTQGERPAGGRPKNRTVTIPVAATGTTKDLLAEQFSDLGVVMDAVRRHGGRITVKHKGQSYRQHLEVHAGTAAIRPAGRRFQERSRADVVLTFTGEPAWRGDPMGWVERFNTDVLAAGAWIHETDTDGDLTVDTTNGWLEAATPAAECRLRNATPGYLYGDVEVVIDVSATSGSGLKAGAVLKRVDATTRLEAYVDDNGTNTRLRVDKVVAGVRTNLASQNASTRIAGNEQARRYTFSLAGPTVRIHYHPGPLGVSSDSPLTHTLSTSDVATFALDDYTVVGLLFTLPSGAKVHRVKVVPFSYYSASLPDVLTLRGEVPGDLPAPTDLYARDVTGEVDFTSCRWALFSWWQAPPGGENLLMWGQAEDDAYPWVVGGGTLTGSPSAFTNVTTVGKHGRRALQVTVSGVNQGIRNNLHRRFVKGVTYTLRCNVLAASGGPTALRLRLGTVADVASAAVTANTSTWTAGSVSWTPTATVDLAYAVVENTAGTSGSFFAEAVEVYVADEGRPTARTQRDGGGGRAPGGLVRAGAFHNLYGWTLTSGLSTTTYLNGHALRRSAHFDGDYLEAFLDLDGLLVPPDDYTQGTIDVEVWARLKLPTTFSPLTAYVGVGGADPYSDPGGYLESPSVEYGHTGRTYTSGSASHFLTFLGTVQVSVDGAGRTRQRLAVRFTQAGTTWTGTLDLDYVLLAPARATCLYPTGGTARATGGVAYPDGESIRITSDLRGGRNFGNWDEEYVPGPGPAGAFIELPAGGNPRLLAAVSGGVPEVLSGPGYQTTPTATRTWDLAVVPTPRWAVMRDS